MVCGCQQRRGSTSANAGSEAGKETASETTANRDSQQVLLNLFFCLTGLGFLFAGLDHHITDSTDRTAAQVILKWLGFWVVGLGGMFLNGAQIEIWQRRRRSKWKIALWLVLNLTFGIVGILLSSFFVVGLWILTSYLIYLGRHVIGLARSTQQPPSRAKHVLNIEAAIVGVISLMIQASWEPACGLAAYEVCFEDCPLPNPTVFNHNALFHVLMVVSLVVQAIAEYKYPTHVTLPMT